MSLTNAATSISLPIKLPQIPISSNLTSNAKAQLAQGILTAAANGIATPPIPVLSQIFGNGNSNLSTDLPINLPPIPGLGTIAPGSVALKDVPVDSKGNILPSFLVKLFNTTSPVNTKLLDPTDPSGLSDFARVGIRMLGHDLYDGKINGDVALRTLLAPNQSNNLPILTEHGTLPPAEQAIYLDCVRKWGQMDLMDDGKINGSAELKLIEDVFPFTDGRNIKGFAKSIETSNASLNAKELYRTTPDVSSPDGLAAFTQSSGVSATQLENFAQWGHRILNTTFTAQGIAQASLNDPTSIDFGLAHYNSDTLAYSQKIATDPTAKVDVGNTMLKLLLSQSTKPTSSFKIPS